MSGANLIELIYVIPIIDFIDSQIGVAGPSLLLGQNSYHTHSLLLILSLDETNSYSCKGDLICIFFIMEVLTYLFFSLPFGETSFSQKESLYW